MADNVATARAFLAALESRDAAAIGALLDEDVVEVLPFAASGSMEPAAVFEGQEAVLHVQTVIVGSFSVIEFLEPHVTAGDDGDTVFVEVRGRRVQQGTGRVYENRYVLKFEFRDGLIHRITEYSNPVAFAMFFDQPVGQPQ